MNMTELYSDIDADNTRRRRQGWIVALVLITVLIVAGWIDSLNNHDIAGYTCYAERSATVEGVEVIAYPPHFVVPAHAGIKVACPQ